MNDQTTQERLAPAAPAPVNAHRRWTATDDECLMSMSAAGKPAAEIGAVVGRSEGAIRQRRRQLLAAQTTPEPTLAPWVFLIGTGAVIFIHATSLEARLDRFARAAAVGDFDRADRIAGRIFRMYGR